MSGHTPTPWSYKRAKFPTDGEFDCAIAAPISGTPFCIAETFGRCATTITLDAEANAAFIVKAVNNHEALTREVELLCAWQRARLETDDAARDEREALVKALQAVVDQVNDYERVNNLAPNPGRTECWDTVAHAKDVLARVGRPLTSPEGK